MRIAKRVEQLKPSGIRVFFDLVLGMKEVVSLGVGEPDFVTPWNIRELGIFALEQGYTTYTSNKGLKDLRVAICRHLEHKLGISYDPEEEILITVGTSQAMDLAARTLLNPGEEALVLDPSYVAYEAVVNLVYAQPKYIPVKKENRFKVLPEQIQRACGKKTKVLILNYPANPTGASYTKKELTALRKVILQKNLFVISDEIYDELSYDYAHTSLLSLPQMKARCLYVNGFSKTYAMTGWRVGFACGPKEVIAGMTKIHQFTMLSAPTISQMAAIEALKNSQRSVLEMKKEYHRRRDFMLQGLNKIGLSCHRPEGAFYLFPSIAKTKFSSMEFCQRLLKEEKAAVVPGTAFGEHGEGHIRISYASSMENLKEALLRMERFLKRHQDEQ